LSLDGNYKQELYKGIARLRTEFIKVKMPEYIRLEQALAEYERERESVYKILLSMPKGSRLSPTDRSYCSSTALILPVLDIIMDGYPARTRT